MTTQRRQLRSLAIDNLEVRLFAQIQVAAFLDLRQLPFTDDVCRTADAATGVSCLKAAGEVKRVREQVITEQHAGFVIPAGIHGCHMASGFSVVQHVIMNERRQVNHLNDSTQNFVILTNSAAGLCRQEQQHRSQPLPSKSGRMFEDVANVRILTAQLIGQNLFGIEQLCTDRLIYRRQNGHSIRRGLCRTIHRNCRRCNEFAIHLGRNIILYHHFFRGRIRHFTP